VVVPWWFFFRNYHIIDSTYEWGCIKLIKCRCVKPGKLISIISAFVVLVKFYCFKKRRTNGSEKCKVILTKKIEYRMMLEQEGDHEKKRKFEKEVRGHEGGPH
jgi:hypothetical protein